MNQDNDSSESKKTKNGKDLEKVISKRNNRLSKLFKSMDLPISIMGDENTPVILFDDKFIVNAYVHNFELRFMDNHTGGNCIYMIKLLETPEFSKEKVLECIHNYPVRYVNKIVLNQTIHPLYLVGYNYSDKVNSERFPVLGSSEKNCLNNEVVNNSILNDKSAFYLTGHNYLDKEQGLGKYPVFSTVNPVVYFSEQKAKEVSEELKNEGYYCDVITCK